MEKEQVTVRLPKELIARVRQYQEDNYLTSFTQAIVSLLNKALEK